jgi:hypothetical protein
MKQKKDGPLGARKKNEVKDSFQGRRWKGETKKDWKMPEKEIKNGGRQGVTRTQSEKIN